MILSDNKRISTILLDSNLKQNCELEPNSDYVIEIDNTVSNKNLSISIPKNSHLQILNCSESNINLDCEINLIGENAKFEYISKNRYSNLTVRNNINVFHKASNTSSYVNIKGIIDEDSQISGQVVLNINPEANNCIAKQKIELINLSSLSKIDFTPILEILNDSCISEHSFSIINLSPQELFYCMSRGINQNLAKKLILNGFLSNRN